MRSNSYIHPLQPSDLGGVRLNVSRDVVISLSHVSMRRDFRRILTDVNLEIHKGDFVAITGPNGGGKTTLLRIILGLLKPTSGTVTVNTPPHAIGYLPQKNTIDSHFPISVREVVESGLLNVKDLSRDERRRRTEETIAQIELQSHSDHPIGRLSGGQLQRALLGRAIISHPQLLILDEPLSYLDKHFEAHIYKLMASIAPHCTILLVSHEMSTISTMANRHLIVDTKVSECCANHHYLRTECD